jgi:hypothetical protein
VESASNGLKHQVYPNPRSTTLREYSSENEIGEADVDVLSIRNRKEDATMAIVVDIKRRCHLDN